MVMSRCDSGSKELQNQQNLGYARDLINLLESFSVGALAGQRNLPAAVDFLIVKIKGNRFFRDVDDGASIK